MTSPLASPGPWDLVASAYSEEIVPQFEHYAREALRLAALPPSSSIVDVATGPGTLACLAAKAGHSVTALDFSSSMLEALRARVAAEGLSAKIDATSGDGMALPFGDASFDAGFSMFGLMFFPDRQKGFRELRRVVRPGAPVVVSSWLPMDRVPLLAAMFAAMAEVTPPPPNAPAYVPPLATREACISEMTEAGFLDVTVHEVAFARAPEPVSAIWESFTRTTAPIVLLKKRLGDEWGAVASAIRQRLETKFGDAVQTVSMPAYLTVGRA